MILKNGTIVNENETISNGYVIIKDDSIIEIGHHYQGDDGLDLCGAFLLPGFIDIHMHGMLGSDVMGLTTEILKQYARVLPTEGITSYLPTTLTDDKARIFQSIQTISTYAYQGGARILGIHLEGPFINADFKGAQNEQFILEPTKQNMENVVGDYMKYVKTITYAIEKADVSFTKWLAESGVIPAVGHSGASFEKVMEHVNAGLKKVTHLYNGQSGHHHRTPGVVTAALYADDLFVELIADGIHVHPDVINTTYKIKGKERIVLVTDSIRAKGMKDGEYSLGGLEAVKKDDQFRLKTGSLAGSILKMNEAAKNTMGYTGCSINDIVSMTSANQARMLHLDNSIGKIDAGYKADLVVLDANMNVKFTMCQGNVQG